MEAIVRQFATREAGARVEEDARRLSNPNVHTVQPPTAPLAGRSLKRLVAAGGLAGGMILAGAMVLLLTLIRRVVATPDEAGRWLLLPALTTFGSQKGSRRQTQYLPEIADLAALLADARVEQRRASVIQFVSAGSNDGRGDLVRSLAVEFAQHRGCKTVLIDLQTNGRDHMIVLGAKAIEAERNPDNLPTSTTTVPNLRVFCDAGSSHLADPHVGQSEARSLMNQLRDNFDLVLIIGPEREESYAMRRLTALVDANVLVVRGESTRGDIAREVRDWVLGSGGRLLGFVYTGLRPILPRMIARLL
jgi:Mrp family chromosome partitioning ATPase